MKNTTTKLDTAKTSERIEMRKILATQSNGYTQYDVGQLKNNYYKAVEGLGALQELLKHFSKVSPVFAAELELATKAIESMDKSFLGRIL